ncbi:MAG TPA: hypothetical protein PK797_14015, partial [Burkholderiaceae bacterium]|nr:hypothetical protein [Burkholderiaceae bacterium]
GRFNHCIRLGVGGRWDAPQRAALARVGAIACAMARGAAAESKASPGLRLEALLSRAELS